MKNRITPSEVIKLTKEQIFVFGSNAEGNHAAGAAGTVTAGTVTAGRFALSQIPNSGYLISLLK